MDRSPDALGKRKQAPPGALDRPTKQMKPDMALGMDDDAMDTNGMLDASDSASEDGRLLPIASMTADTAEWQATIEKVVRNVVSIRFCQTCAFDTDPATSSEATGFVVDAERGYILTNRHVRSVW